jgi:hypothetical protein
MSKYGRPSHATTVKYAAYYYTPGRPLATSATISSWSRHILSLGALPYESPIYTNRYFGTSTWNSRGPVRGKSHMFTRILLKFQNTSERMVFANVVDLLFADMHVREIVERCRRRIVDCPQSIESTARLLNKL